MSQADQREVPGDREEEVGVNHLMSVESESRGKEEIYTLLCKRTGQKCGLWTQLNPMPPSPLLRTRAGGGRVEGLASSRSRNSVKLITRPPWVPAEREAEDG